MINKREVIISSKGDESNQINSSIENFRPSKYTTSYSKNRVGQSGGDEILQVNDILSARNKLLSSSINFLQGSSKTGSSTSVTRNNIPISSTSGMLNTQSSNSLIPTVVSNYNNYISPRSNDNLKTCTSHRVLQVQDLNASEENQNYNSYTGKAQRSSTVEKSVENRKGYPSEKETTSYIENYFSSQGTKKNKYIQPGTSAYILKGAISGQNKECSYGSKGGMYGKKEDDSGSSSVMSTSSYDDKRANKYTFGQREKQTENNQEIQSLMNSSSSYAQTQLGSSIQTRKLSNDNTARRSQVQSPVVNENYQLKQRVDANPSESYAGNTFQSFIRKSLEGVQTGVQTGIQKGSFSKNILVQNEASVEKRVCTNREEKKDLKRQERNKKERKGVQAKEPRSNNEAIRCSYNDDIINPSFGGDILKTTTVISPNKRVPTKESISKQSAQIDQTLSNYLESLKNKRNNIKSSSFLKKFVTNNSGNMTIDTTNLPDSQTNTSGSTYSLSEMMRKFLSENSESKTPVQPKRYANNYNNSNAMFISEYSSTAVPGSDYVRANKKACDLSGYRSNAVTSSNPKKTSDIKPQGGNPTLGHKRQIDTEDLTPITSSLLGSLAPSSSKNLGRESGLAGIFNDVNKRPLERVPGGNGDQNGLIPIDSLTLLQKGFHDIYKRESISRNTDPKHLDNEENKARSVPATTRHSSSGNNPISNLFMNFLNKSTNNQYNNVLVAEYSDFSPSKISAHTETGFKYNSSKKQESDSFGKKNLKFPDEDEEQDYNLSDNINNSFSNCFQADFKPKDLNPELNETPVQEEFCSWANQNFQQGSKNGIAPAKLGFDIKKSENFLKQVEQNSEDNFSRPPERKKSGDSFCKDFAQREKLDAGKVRQIKETSSNLLSDRTGFHNYEISAQTSNASTQRNNPIQPNEANDKMNLEVAKNPLPKFVESGNFIDSRKDGDVLSDILTRVKGILELHSKKESSWRREKESLIMEIEQLRSQVNFLEGYRS